MWGGRGGGVGDGEVGSIQENDTKVCIDMNGMFEREENEGWLKDEYIIIRKDSKLNIEV